MWEGLHPSTMTYPISANLLGIERRLTAQEIMVYKINAGPGGTWVREWYESDIAELREYRFHLRSVVMDNEGYYYLTICKACDTEEPHNP